MADVHTSGIAALAAAIKPYRKLYEVLKVLDTDQEVKREMGELMAAIVTYKSITGAAPYRRLLGVVNEVAGVMLEIQALEAGQVCGLVRTGDQEPREG